MPLAWRHARIADNLQSRFLPHDALYNERYFTGLEKSAAAAAPYIARSIVTTFEPTRVIDVGCGTGELLLEIQKLNCAGIDLEYASAALERCHAKGLDVERFDLERDVVDQSEKFDVAISLEVAEHLPPTLADRYIDLLTGFAPIIVFTAAVPGQGGRDHVNEQPHSYWLTKFGAHGFYIDAQHTDEWSKEWRATGQVAQWYWSNLMVLSERTRSVRTLDSVVR